MKSWIAKGQFIVDADATQTQRKRRNVKNMQITWFINSRRRRNADATQTQKSRVKKFNFLLRLICVTLFSRVPSPLSRLLRSRWACVASALRLRCVCVAFALRLRLLWIGLNRLIKFKNFYYFHKKSEGSYSLLTSTPSKLYIRLFSLSISLEVFRQCGANVY